MEKLDSVYLTDKVIILRDTARVITGTCSGAGTSGNINIGNVHAEVGTDIEGGANANEFSANIREYFQARLKEIPALGIGDSGGQFEVVLEVGSRVEATSTSNVVFTVTNEGETNVQYLATVEQVLAAQ